jgi:hypothetical protein
VRHQRLPSRPVEVTRPSDVGTEWSWLRWDRRAYREVNGPDDKPPVDVTEVDLTDERRDTPADRLGGPLTPPRPGVVA